MLEFSAYYNDGRTAATRSVNVRLDTGCLNVQAPEGDVLARWLFDEVHLVDRPVPGQPIRLRRGDEGGERLIVADEEVLASLEAACPNLRRTLPGLGAHWRPIAIWSALAVASVILVLFVAIPLLAEQAAKAVPAELEQELGEAVARQLVNTLGARREGGADGIVCETPAGAAALDRLVERLAEGTESHVPFRVRVLDVPVVNALALPGGQIILFRGLLAFSENSEQLAGVLAHEMGHVIHRHTLEAMVKGAGIAALLGLVVGDFTGAAVITGLADAVITTSFTRDAEREADRAALRILAAAEIDSRPVADFFRRLETERVGGIDLPSLLSTHPPLPERTAAARAGAGGGSAAMTRSDWRALEGICG
ncbi:MAG: M48 family metallopeptidase [Alphaproteobacteria bacterium]